MSVKLRLPAAFAAICLALLAAAPARAESFALPDIAYSAERRVQAGERWQEMRVHYSPGKERMEFTGAAAGGNVMIVRYDQGLAWLLMPGMRAYMEVPSDIGGQVMALTEDVRLEPEGRERVNGATTTRHRASGRFEGRVWLTDDGIPVRIEGRAAIDGQRVPTRIEQRDITRTRPEPALFQLPAGFMRIPLNDPRMLEMLRQMLSGR